MEAGNDRDRVYAILGLSRDAVYMVPALGYDKPVADVYEDFVTAHIRIKGNMDIISLARIRTQKYMLPSWVPDFTAVEGQLNFALDYIVRILFWAVSYTESLVAFSKHIMRMEGVCIDELDGLSGSQLARPSFGTKCAYATAHEALIAI
jgi:hypothetical protein